jgi:hypothetical protein
MLARLEDEELQAFGIDGTERRIQRPAEDERQRQHYSGKKTRIVNSARIAALTASLGDSSMKDQTLDRRFWLESWLVKLSLRL